MQIVIDIPERIRVAILNGEYCGILDDRIFNAIANGTPLGQEPCEDCISRQAAIETIFEQGSVEKLEIDFAKLLLLQRAIKALPPVNPQPKTGHWIRVDKDKLKCSECEVIHLIAQYPDGKIDWCPNCGTKMVEPQERNDKK